MDPDDFKELRKVCIRLSMRMGTSLEYFMGLPIRELMAVTKDVIEVMEDDREVRGKTVK